MDKEKEIKVLENTLLMLEKTKDESIERDVEDVKIMALEEEIESIKGRIRYIADSMTIYDKLFKSENDGYELIKNNQFVVEFPIEFGIEPFYVKKCSLSNENRVFKVWLKNIFKDKALTDKLGNIVKLVNDKFDSKLHIDINVVDRNRVLLYTIRLSQLTFFDYSYNELFDYESSEIDSIYCIFKFDKKEYIYYGRSAEKEK